MTTKSATKESSKGICNFCNNEFDKAKMTQHLKYCKQRAAAIAAEAQDPTKQKTKLFHLLAEGHYNPQYWLHLEMPASEDLNTLDDFLRGIWLEHFDHLSAFKIADTSYSTEPDDLLFALGEVVETKVEVEEGELDDIVDGKALLKQFPRELLKVLPSNLLSELKKSQPVDDLVTLLREALKSIPKRSRNSIRTPEEVEESRRHYFQREILETLLDMVEDRSMYVLLEKVLKVGQKFSYEYDFGSTTHINLKVVSEREGILRDEKQPVEILARNNAPSLLCQVCGKPATYVTAGYYSAEESGYCDKCAKKIRDTEMLVSMTNSPRVGVL